jgi:hypothetical protein
MDKRDEILLKEFDVQCEDIQLAVTLNPDVNKIKNAMDENGRLLCLELLEYMAKNNVRIAHNSDNRPIFRYKENWITAEQLFENFL